MDTKKSDYHPTNTAGSPSTRLDDLRVKRREWEAEYKDVLESDGFVASISPFVRMFLSNKAERKEPRKKKKRPLQAGVPVPPIETTVISMQDGVSRNDGES